HLDPALLLFPSLPRRPPRSPLFPYTTLFRSEDPAWPHDGVQVRTAALRLGENPALAGLKHCNRLEQVLARNEWTDPGIAEALLLDRKSTRLNSSHLVISYAVFCLKKKKHMAA